MRYFTPDLLERFGSLDDDVADAANAESERVSMRYQRHWEKIQSLFPESVQRFNNDSVCLHDAQVLSIGRDQDTFVLVLQLEAPSTQIIMLSFTLADEPVIDPQALSAEGS